MWFQKRKATIDKLGDDTSPDPVNINDLYLVTLDHVSKASWQPQFMIVRDA